MFIMDTHADSVLDFADKLRTLKERSIKGQVDIPRLRQGGVGAQIFAAYIGGQYIPEHAAERAFELLAWMHKQLAEAADAITLATTAEGIKRANQEGKIAALLSIEGGEAVGEDLGNLERFAALGVSSICLTWNYTNLLGAGCKEEDPEKGLTDFGREAVRAMNRLGIVVDLAHAAEKTFYDTLEISSAPIIVSHGNSRKIWDHRRNLTDQQIKAVAQAGGTIGVTFVPDFVHGERPGIDTLVDHIDHLAEVGGINVVGIGSDFDGTDVPLPGLEDAGKIPDLVNALRKRGYGEQDIRGIMGENHLRVWKAVCG